MKILISADMEGISGVTLWDHVDPSQGEYQRFRRIMTREVNSAVEGVFLGGGTEVLVTDGHWNGTNILIEELDNRVKINSGLGTSQASMMQGIDSSFDGVVFIGYHARASSENGILDHTWSSKITNVWLNGTLVGEYGLNAALAGQFNVPVIFMSGDQTACRQARELLGKVETVTVKEATGRHSALCLPPVIAQGMIRETVKKAMIGLKNGDAPSAYVVPKPVQIEVEYISSDMLDKAVRIPGSKRKGNRLLMSSPDMLSAYISFRAAAGLASV